MSNNIRMLRVGELIRRELAIVFQKHNFRNPLLQNVNLTITEVVMSQDLSFARIYVYPFWKNKDFESLQKALIKVTPYLQRVLSGRLSLRIIPQLKFFLDDGFEHMKKIENILSSLMVK